jgi:hypothetical protein
MKEGEETSFREVRGRSWRQQSEVGGHLGEVNGDYSKQCLATCLKLPCPNLVISKKLSDLICSVCVLYQNCLKDIYLMSNIYLCLLWLLESRIPVNFYMYPHPLFLLKYYCAYVTQIVIRHICVVFSRR